MPQLALAAALWLLSLAALAAEAPLTLGLFPYVSRGQLMEFHTPLKLYLEGRLKRPVDLVTAPDFAEFMARTQRGEYDLVLTAPHLGRLAEKRDGYVRVAMTAHEVQGVFLVRRDSGIHRLEDLRGKTVMIAQPISIVHQLAVEHLRRHGLVPGKDLRILDTRTHNNALYAPARGEADASATGILLWVNAEPAIREAMREIDRTPPVPGFMVMAHKRVPPALVRQLRHWLLEYSGTPEGERYFQVTGLKAFRPIDDKTMKALDPYTRILTETTP